MEQVDSYFQKRKEQVDVYLYGSFSLIAQDITRRETKDADLHLRKINPFSLEEVLYGLPQSIDSKLLIDISANGNISIFSKNYSWVIPEEGFERAINLRDTRYANIFALHYLDILALKLERFARKDQLDILSILDRRKPSMDDAYQIVLQYTDSIGNNDVKNNILRNFQTVRKYASSL